MAALWWEKLKKATFNNYGGRFKGASEFSGVIAECFRGSLKVNP